MMEWITGTGAIFAGFFAGDEFFSLRSALRTEYAWLWGLIVTILGGLLVQFVYRVVPWVERNLEPTLMVVSYLAIGGIIFVEVIRRFIFSTQFPWSTTIPGYLFLIMCWVGCSYNVKLRTHLAFSEFRTKMPRGLQMAALSLDAMLWLGVCWLVMVTGMRVTANAGSNYMLVTGTNDVFVWWFMITLPLAFILLAGRVFQNLGQDIATYKSGEPMIQQAVLGGQ